LNEILGANLRLRQLLPDKRSVRNLTSAASDRGDGGGPSECSSPFGRRRFIAVDPRNIQRSGCGLRDVQVLAGPRPIETKERCIDSDTPIFDLVMGRLAERAAARQRGDVDIELKSV
jgi:hypothetical protein